MTPGSFLLGLVYYAVALLCLAAFKSKKKSADTQRGVQAHLQAVRSFLRAVIERRTQLPELARAAAPWFLLALFMVVLGASRQLNLQALLTTMFQTEAIVDGWYEDRRDRQLRFIGGAAIAMAVVGIATLILLRKRLSDVGIAVLAAMMLVVLLVIRATSHHGVDEVLMSPAFGLAPAYWIEMLGLLVIAGSALISVRRSRSRASS